MFRHVCLAQISIEVLAHIGRQTVEHAAQLEDGVLGRPAGQRADGKTDCARFRQPTLARPCLESIEIGLVEVHLQRPPHDVILYTIMMIVSTFS
ncbi:MAG TPA: hypothetical protein VMS22_16630 [Candidatus Eisenbacteria bacterium]|nr:hypothetical protein [Candidatus Eisenbacteria bacterium]